MINYEEQFSRIYDQYIEKIYRFVYLKVSSREVAEDISSRVFMKGWETVQSGGEITEPAAFLYRVARNMVVDHYRTQARTKTISVDAVPQAIDQRTDIHERAIANADLETVKLAMRHIKKDYQDVLIWHYLEDMPTAEISKILRKSEGAVRVMLHRGIKSLQGQLERGEV